MTMITPSYLGETIEYSSLHACRSTLEDPTPSLAIAELMRILRDIHGISWADAWRITQWSFSYTNHTLLPEALESWPVALLERMLPRHLQIIYRINAEHLELARTRPNCTHTTLAALSLIDEHHGRRVRMGHLAFAGSHRVNGVSRLHSELLQDTVFRELNALYPGRIVNKTNGITFRRWLKQANPGLAGVVGEICGEGVFDAPMNLSRLAKHAGDSVLQECLQAVKQRNKSALASLISARLDLRVNPHAIFDVHIKRIHEYKRQLLNLLETVAVYQAIRDEPQRGWTPRVKIFAGKAAATYGQAKLVIKLINDVAQVINGDPLVRDLLRVVFLPDYNVSLAEAIIPAADVSEQISTAGMEASGTGNMKLALNGALTIGTFDGANVEICEQVGEDNIFIFGMLAEEVAERRRSGPDGDANIEACGRLSEVIAAIEAGVFSPDDRHRFTSLTRALRHNDYYMVTGDFPAYFETQRQMDALWGSRNEWMRKSICNIAAMGWFSSDRAIAEYAEEIWKVPCGDPA